MYAFFSEKFPVNCIEHGGKCYNIYAEAKPARDAELACQGITAQRLKIEEESQETTILKDLFQEGLVVHRRAAVLTTVLGLCISRSNIHLYEMTN